MSPPFNVIDNPLFFDQGLDDFEICLNPSFNMSIPHEYGIASFPPPFMLNHDYGEFTQNFAHI